MKKQLLTLIVLLSISTEVNAQMTLAHRFAGSAEKEGAIVNLSRSGKKILSMNLQGYPARPDTLFFYNMDYSFWKMIPCPYIPGYGGNFNFYSQNGWQTGVFYPSETLFNTDTFLEVAVIYLDSASGISGKLLVINENGSIVDSILNITAHLSSNFRVVSDSSGAFKATVTTFNGMEIYNLPGTLPCEACVTSSLGTAHLDERKSFISQPIPNPSKDQVRISFTLPDGVAMAELQVYDINGKRVKTYKVDNNFGFVLLDNSQLTAGTYLYNIVVDGAISSTQKFVVIR